MNVEVVPSTRPVLSLMRPPVAQQRFALRDLLIVVFYHKRAMLLAFLVPLIIALAAAAVTRPVFVAQARLLVLYGSEYFYRPAAGQTNANVALDRNEIMLGELQVLQSMTLAMETLEAVGVDRVYPGTPAGDPRALDHAALRMANDLTATVIAQSNVLELSFRSYDPDVAAAVLRSLIDNYFKRRVTIFQHSPTASAQAEQSAFLGRVHAAEDALSSFADKHNIANPDQQLNLLLQQQSRDTQARNEALQAVSETTARLEAVRKELGQLPLKIQSYDESNRSQTSLLLTDNLMRLQNRRRELASRYQDSFPAMQALDRQIAGAQAEIAREPQREQAVVHEGLNPVYQDVQAQEAALQAQLQGLQAKLTELEQGAMATDARIKDITVAARQYRDLQRNRDLLDESYRVFVRNNEEAQIADTAERNRAANIRVIQPPERPAVGHSLRGILIAGGGMVGLIAAIAALATCNALKQTFVSTRDTGVGLELPVLAAVGNRRQYATGAGAGTGTSRDLRAPQLKLAGLPHDRLPESAPSAGAPAIPEPPAHAEARVSPHFLDTADGDRLVHMLRNRPGVGTIVQVIASGIGEGVSSLARDLALVAARTGRTRVLLLDLSAPGDVQVKALLGEFGATISQTRQLMAAPRDVVIHRLGLETLYVSEIRGTPSAGPSVWIDLFPTLRTDFDLVIIDSPSSDRSHDGIMLAPDLDVTFLIVEAEKTRSAVAQNLRDRILDAGGCIGGVILNKRRFYLPGFIYRYL
jgi:uncharacterized protein involved in exopolysaccharide biosynthesis/Mrp family chromosome partitioning ATPase